MPDQRAPRSSPWALALLAGLLIGTSVAFHWSALDHWALEWLRYLPFPAYLLLATLALVLSWRLALRWRLTALASLLAVVWLAMGGVVGQADNGAVPLRVMTYNIKAYLAEGRHEGFGRIAAEIAEHSPDVVLLQDAQQLVGPERQLAPELRALLGGRHAFAEGELVIASRYALRDCRSLAVPGTRALRPAIACRATVGGLPVEIATVHLLSPRQGLNATRRDGWDGFAEWRANYRERQLQASWLAEQLPSPGVHLILGGDFNAPEHSPVLRSFLQSGLRDAFSAAGLGFGYTVGHALRPGISLLRLDHLLVSAGIGVENCFVGSADASEHRPVIADLWLLGGI